MNRSTEPTFEQASASLLVDIKTLSILLDRSVSALERDQAAGRLPPHLKVGSSKRWRRSDIETWVAAGCPCQSCISESMRD